MSEALILIGSISWVASGVWSHIYWVRNKYDYTSDYLGTSVMSGLIGPLSFWVGWTVYGSEPKPKLLLRKRS